MSKQRNPLQYRVRVIQPPKCRCWYATVSPVAMPDLETHTLLCGSRESAQEQAELLVAGLGGTL